jgi:chromosome segregation ATPase
MPGMPAVNTQTLVLRLSVELPGDFRPVAEEYMRAVVRNFSQTLNQAFEQHRDRLRDQLNVAAEEAARAENELRDMQNKLREISGSRLLYRPQIINDIENARQYIERLQMDQAESTPRWESISKQIAETEAKLDKQLANDSVTKELAQIAEINNKQLSQMETRVQGGQAASSELEQVREKLARARIELAQRQEQLSKPARNTIESLNKNLADYSLMKTQNAAKMTQYDRQIQEAANLLAVADQYEILSLKADVIKQNLQEAIRWRDQMERRNRMVLPPSVTVIGAE